MAVHEVESEKFEIENSRRQDDLATKQLSMMKQTEVLVAPPPLDDLAL